MMTNLKRRRRRCCKKRKKVMMTNLERWRWRCWRCCGCCKPAPKPTRPPRPEETYEYLSLPTGADIEEGDTNHKNPDYTWAAYDANFVHKFQILKDQRIKKAATFGCWRVSENRPARIRKRYKMKKDQGHFTDAISEVFLEIVWQKNKKWSMSENDIKSHGLATDDKKEGKIKTPEITYDFDINNAQALDRSSRHIMFSKILEAEGRQGDRLLHALHVNWGTRKNPTSLALVHDIAQKDYNNAKNVLALMDFLKKETKDLSKKETDHKDSDDNEADGDSGSDYSSEFTEDDIEEDPSLDTMSSEERRKLRQIFDRYVKLLDEFKKKGPKRENYDHGKGEESNPKKKKGPLKGKEWATILHKQKGDYHFATPKRLTYEVIAEERRRAQQTLELIDAFIAHRGSFSQYAEVVIEEDAEEKKAQAIVEHEAKGKKESIETLHILNVNVGELKISEDWAKVNVKPEDKDTIKSNLAFSFYLGENENVFKEHDLKMNTKDARPGMLQTFNMKYSNVFRFDFAHPDSYSNEAQLQKTFHLNEEKVLEYFEGEKTIKRLKESIKVIMKNIAENETDQVIYDKNLKDILAKDTSVDEMIKEWQKKSKEKPELEFSKAQRKRLFELEPALKPLMKRKNRDKRGNNSDKTLKYSEVINCIMSMAMLTDKNAKPTVERLLEKKRCDKKDYPKEFSKQYMTGKEGAYKAATAWFSKQISALKADFVDRKFYGNAGNDTLYRHIDLRVKGVATLGGKRVFLCKKEENKKNFETCNFETFIPLSALPVKKTQQVNVIMEPTRSHERESTWDAEHIDDKMFPVYWNKKSDTEPINRPWVKSQERSYKENELFGHLRLSVEHYVQRPPKKKDKAKTAKEHQIDDLGIVLSHKTKHIFLERYLKGHKKEDLQPLHRNKYMSTLSGGQYFQVKFSRHGTPQAAYNRRYVWCTNKEAPYGCVETIVFAINPEDFSSQLSVHAENIQDVRVATTDSKAKVHFKDPFFKRGRARDALELCADTDLTIVIAGLGWDLQIQTYSVDMRNQWYRSILWLAREANRVRLGKEEQEAMLSRKKNYWNYIRDVGAEFLVVNNRITSKHINNQIVYLIKDHVAKKALSPVTDTLLWLERRFPKPPESISGEKPKTKKKGEGPFLHGLWERRKTLAATRLDKFFKKRLKTIFNGLVQELNLEKLEIEKVIAQLRKEIESESGKGVDMNWDGKLQCIHILYILWERRTKLKEKEKKSFYKALEDFSGLDARGMIDAGIENVMFAELNSFDGKKCWFELSLLDPVVMVSEFKLRQYERKIEIVKESENKSFSSYVGWGTEKEKQAVKNAKVEMMRLQALKKKEERLQKQIKTVHAEKSKKDIHLWGELHENGKLKGQYVISLKDFSKGSLYKSMEWKSVSGEIPKTMNGAKVNWKRVETDFTIGQEVATDPVNDILHLTLKHNNKMMPMPYVGSCTFHNKTNISIDLVGYGLIQVKSLDGIVHDREIRDTYARIKAKGVREVSTGVRWEWKQLQKMFATPSSPVSEACQQSRYLVWKDIFRKKLGAEAEKSEKSDEGKQTHRKSDIPEDEGKQTDEKRMNFYNPKATHDVFKTYFYIDEKNDVCCDIKTVESVSIKDLENSEYKVNAQRQVGKIKERLKRVGISEFGDMKRSYKELKLGKSDMPSLSNFFRQHMLLASLDNNIYGVVDRLEKEENEYELGIYSQARIVEHWPRTGVTKNTGTVQVTNESKKSVWLLSVDENGRETHEQTIKPKPIGSGPRSHVAEMKEEPQYECLEYFEKDLFTHLKIRVRAEDGGRLLFEKQMDIDRIVITVKDHTHGMIDSAQLIKFNKNIL